MLWKENLWYSFVFRSSNLKGWHQISKSKTEWLLPVSFLSPLFKWNNLQMHENQFCPSRLFHRNVLSALHFLPASTHIPCSLSSINSGSFQFHKMVLRKICFNFSFDKYTLVNGIGKEWNGKLILIGKLLIYDCSLRCLEWLLTRTHFIIGTLESYTWFYFCILQVSIWIEQRVNYFNGRKNPAMNGCKINELTLLCKKLLKRIIMHFWLLKRQRCNMAALAHFPFNEKYKCIWWEL